MAQNHFKTWKLVAVFTVIFSLLVYVLFIVAFTNNVVIEKQQLLNIPLSNTAVQEPDFSMQLASQMLLHPNTKIHGNDLILIINESNNSCNTNSIKYRI